MDYNQDQSYYLVIYDFTAQFGDFSDPIYSRKMKVIQLDPETFMERTIFHKASYEDYRFVAYAEISESEYNRLLDEDIDIK